MERIKTYKWFIAPKGGHTNQVIADALASDGLPNLPITTQLLPYKGKELPMWEVDYSFIGQAQASKEKFELMFRVFRQRIEKGKLQEWFFHKRKRLSKKTADAKKQLKQVCEKKSKNCPF
jgi:hypothetical protein